MLVRAGLGVALGLAVGMAGLTSITTESGLARYSSQANSSNSAFTSAACFPGNTGFLNPSANAADTGGDDNGFELNPTDAYADGGGYSSNVNGALDSHRYYDYGVAVDGSCAIDGIELRMDWWLDSTADASDMQAELSWDGGTSWTAVKTDTEKTSSEHTAILGGSTDTWGRTWTVDELSNANFRVRLTSYSCCSSTWTYRDFYLDWLAVKVYYGP